jgi:hypothetical protein
MAKVHNSNNNKKQILGQFFGHKKTDRIASIGLLF